MLTTTLREIRSHGPCSERWPVLLRKLGGMRAFGVDTPLPVSKILDLMGLDDTLWVIDKINPTVVRLLAVGFCTPALRLMEDIRSREVVKVSHLYAHGEATDAELEAASAAAWDAASTAARYATWAAACAAASTAARYATRESSSTAYAAASAIRAVAWTAAWVARAALTDAEAAYAAARTEQKRLVRYVCDNWEDDKC